MTTAHCLPCEGFGAALSKEDASKQQQKVPDWQLNTTTTEISRRFEFKNFHAVMAFVNAVAWIAHQEKHHPDIEFGYNYCLVRYSTHALKGLSPNDFICATKVDALLQ